MTKRLLDLSRLFPGPYCARIFADWGFEVIKIEPPGGGDWARHVPPLDASSGQGLLFRALNRGKKSLSLNLKSDQGRAILLQLVEGADVLLEGFRPGVMARLGVGYEALSAANPGLVYCSLSGYGPRGPYRDRAGHDLNYVGLAGLLDLTGPRDGPPVLLGAPVADLSGALWAAVGILLALLEREQTGQGQRVDASLLGGALSCMSPAVAQTQGGEPLERGAGDLTGGVVCYNIYATADGGYVTLSALEPAFWAAFCGAADREDLLDQQFAPAVDGEPAYESLRALFRTRSRQAWIEALQGVDACCEPVYTVEEALASPPVQALGMASLQGLLPPLHFSGRDAPSPQPAPALGQHTSELLAQLGYDAPMVARLQEEGVV
ncbi:MAG: CoA transferase [Anaerolineae bacterium]|nr:CoA transferase [Anaerolineae bacterium]